MGVKNIFKRYELKFMLTTQQYINNPKLSLFAQIEKTFHTK